MGAGYTFRNGSIRSNLFISSVGGHWGGGAGFSMTLDEKNKIFQLNFHLPLFYTIFYTSVNILYRKNFSNKKLHNA
ncbi:hypothetical protein [Bartonella washoeensis]|uniref:hypothetical protein n=1 Tax=Candidatus Bartonella washoeensis TaxID=186739 RepID=UPI000D503480